MFENPDKFKTLDGVQPWLVWIYYIALYLTFKLPKYSDKFVENISSNKKNKQWECS